MRIISGRYGSRRIEAPKGLNTRPTLDRTRESLFNMLQGEVPGTRVLDLFAGSGALGLEALSRGAEFCVFCDGSREAVKALKANIASLGAEALSRVLFEDCLTAVDKLARQNESFDLVFLDPPYASDAGPVMRRIVSSGLLASDGLIVFEHDEKADFMLPQGLKLQRAKRYGRTALDFIIRNMEE